MIYGAQNVETEITYRLILSQSNTAFSPTLHSIMRLSDCSYPCDGEYWDTLLSINSMSYSIFQLNKL